jgi:TonB family protein
MRCLVVTLLAVVFPSCLVAQNSQKDLGDRLVKKPLYLRGQCAHDKVSFDEAGHVIGSADRITFTLSGFEARSVKLTGRELVVEGRRIGLEFDHDRPKRVELEDMTLRIKRPANDDFTPALNTIFTDDLADLAPQLPSYWQSFAKIHFLGISTPDDAAAGDTPKIAKVGGKVSAPRPLAQVEPKFNNVARSLKYGGTIVVSLIVGVDGKPTHLQVQHAAGLGLDEQALAAVSKYTFAPAMQDGSPVPVQLNIETTFDIY